VTPILIPGMANDTSLLASAATSCFYVCASQIPAVPQAAVLINRKW
jgi:hypothetical protein